MALGVIFLAGPKKLQQRLQGGGEFPDHCFYRIARTGPVADLTTGSHVEISASS
jgi:hypothetical protein